jgi:hypothetical protein
MESSFPPRFVPGNRVWTTKGYRDHGPMGGPKVDISPEMGGTIVECRREFPSSDLLLCTIRWDEGRSSTHYAAQLFCIGRFASLADFKAAIEVEHVRLSVGPRGGFRGSVIRLRFDGFHQQSELVKS